MKRRVKNEVIYLFRLKRKSVEVSIFRLEQHEGQKPNFALIVPMHDRGLGLIFNYTIIRLLTYQILSANGTAGIKTRIKSRYRLHDALNSIVDGEIHAVIMRDGSAQYSRCGHFIADHPVLSAAEISGAVAIPAQWGGRERIIGKGT